MLKKTVYIQLLIAAFIVSLFQSSVIYEKSNFLENSIFRNDYISLRNSFLIEKSFQFKSKVEVFKFFIEHHYFDFENQNNVILTTVSKEPLKEVKDLKIEDSVLNKEVTKTENLDNNKSNVVLNNMSQHNNIKKSILLIGDSMMGDVGFSLKRFSQDWNIIDKHKVSSGLSNQNYYDWVESAKDLLKEYQPTYLIVLIGTNDAQSLISNKKVYGFNKDLWGEIYKQKMLEIIHYAKENHTNIIWIAQPIMRDISFENKIKIIRKIQEKTALEENINYIENDDIFSVNGTYSATIEVNHKLRQLRANDGIHIGTEGANQLVIKLNQLIK